MSDTFFAVQFRSMHTAVHSIAIFSLESKAEELFQILDETEMMPDEIEFPFEPQNFVDTQEIDYRSPQQFYPEADAPDAIRLTYINGDGTLNHVPDVYNY